MIDTGMARKLDALGRVVLPKELRETLQINIGDSLAVYVDETSIYLMKYEPACIFCGEARDLEQRMGKRICRNCLDELKMEPAGGEAVR